MADHRPSRRAAIAPSGFPAPNGVPMYIGIGPGAKSVGPMEIVVLVPAPPRPPAILPALAYRQPTENP